MTLANVSIIFGLAPVIFGLIRVKYISKYKLPIFFLSILSFIFELINYYLAEILENNFYVFHLYTLIEFLFISMFYYLFFKKHFNVKFLLIPIALFLVSVIIDYRVNSLSHFDNYATAFEAIIFCILSLLSFYYIAQKTIFERLLSEPFFWINIGVLFYFGGNLVLFVFNDYLISHESSNHIALWAIHSVVNIFYNIILAIGFWKTKRL